MTHRSHLATVPPARKGVWDAHDLEEALLAALPDSAAVKAVLTGIDLDTRDLDAVHAVSRALREVRVRAGHIYGETSWDARTELNNQIHRYYWGATQHLKGRPLPLDGPYSEGYLCEWQRLYGWLSLAALETLLARPRQVSLTYLRFLVKEYRLGNISLEELEAGP